MSMQTQTQPLLGRCRDCDYALFATDEDVRPATDLSDIKQSQVVYQVEHTFLARCPQRHRVFVLRRIKGTYSEVHECDARCLNAKGHDCTCSCGGANHGRGYAATAHVASEAPSLFLGEIGKYIRGEARIVAKRPIRDDSTLYSFLTPSGQSAIKWFVPIDADPGFEVGQEVAFRAKVKKHEDNEYGKATVVTYLEEV